jgi:hypothetical protein
MKVSQIDLVADISKALEKRGHTHVESRHFNAIIEAANIICAEFSRESVGATDGMGLAAWLRSDDTGLSSKYMAHVCAGGPTARNEHPLDPSDFGRCYRFLRAVPEARDNLHRLKDSGAVWAAYVDHWDEMERLYEEEMPTGRAPKLYALMQRLRKESDQ